MANTTQEQDEIFIGRGLVFPLELVNGSVKVSTGPDLINSSIKHIIETTFGTRFFLGEFNCRVNELLHEPNNSVTLSLLQFFITEAIARWERRIALTEIQLDQTSFTKATITLTYEILNSKKEETFIFPFYRKIIY